VRGFDRLRNSTAIAVRRFGALLVTNLGLR
jgi:hypothetical protein